MSSNDGDNHDIIDDIIDDLDDLDESQREECQEVTTVFGRLMMEHLDKKPHHSWFGQPETSFRCQFAQQMNLTFKNLSLVAMQEFAVTWIRKYLASTPEQAIELNDLTKIERPH